MILVPLVLVLCLIIGLRSASTRRARIESHLKRLEFWDRRQFGRSNWKDLFRQQAWRGVLRGPRPDAGQEADKEYEALVALGYMTNCSFALSLPVTNKADFASLLRRVRAATFSDIHWRLASHSNRIDATICVKDVAAWDAVIRTWVAQLPSTQPDGAANERRARQGQ